MADLATLAIAVDSRPAAAAAADLTKLAGAAQGAAQAAGNLGSAVTRGAAAMAGAAQAANQNAQAIAGAANSFRTLAVQVPDVVSQLAAGSNILTTITQQGLQVGQQWAMQGGILPSLRSVGTTLTGLLSPARLFFGAAAAGAVAATTALLQYRAAQEQVFQSLQGIGRGSGATVGSINRFAEANAGPAGLSVGATRAIAAEFAATGRIGQDQFGNLTRVVKDLASTLGVDLAEATTRLAQSFADPTKGADALNERLGTLSDRARQTITNLQAQGNLRGAQGVLQQVLKESDLTSAAARQNPLQRAAEAALNFAKDEWDKFGRDINRIITGPDLQEQLANAIRSRANLQALAARGLISQQRAGQGDFLVGGLGFADETEQVNNFTRARTIDQARLSLVAGAAVRAGTPEEQQLQEIENRAKVIRDALSSRSPLDNLGQAHRSLAQSEQLARSLAEDLTKGGATFASSLREAQFTLSQAGAAGLGAQIARINQNINEQLRTAGTPEARSSLEAIRGFQTEAARREGLIAPAGSFSTSVRDAPEQFRRLIQDASISNPTITPDFLASILRVESNFNSQATGRMTRFGRAQGIAQFLPGTAAELGVDPYDPFSAIPGSARYLAQQRARFGSDVAAAAAYNAGPETVARNIAANGGQLNIAALPAETRAYIQKVFGPNPDLSQSVDAFRQLEQARDTELNQLRNTEQNYGRNNLELERGAKFNELYAAAIARGERPTTALAEALGGYARTAAEAAQASRAIQLSRDLEFDRAQLGRTPTEATVASTLRGRNIDADSPAGRNLADLVRMNEALKTSKDLASDFGKSFAQDIARGTAPLTSLTNAVDRLKSRLIDMAVDNLVSRAFGALLGGATGTGGLLSGLFGGGSLPTLAQGGFGPDIPRVAHGGGVIGTDYLQGRYIHPAYFENAPRYHSGLMPGEMPAILQRGEGVFTAGQMAALGRGVAGSGGVTVHVNNAPAGTGATARQSPDGNGGTRVDIDLIAQGVEATQAARMARGQGPMAALSRTGRYGANRG